MRRNHGVRHGGKALILCAVLVAGCTYPGPWGPSDYEMAASPQWIVQLGNDGWRKQPFTAPYTPGGGVGESRLNTALGCGYVEPVDPDVAYDYDTQRFFYTMLMANGWICLSSAPNADPFALDRQLALPLSYFGGDTDFPKLTVSMNKIAITNFRPDSFDTVTAVLNKAQFLAGQAVAHATINHGGRVTLVDSVGPAAPILWVIPSTGQMTIGIITGVPGAGGVTTATRTVVGDGVPSFDSLAVPMPGGATLEPRGHLLLATPHALSRNFGNSAMSLTTVTRIAGGTQLSVARYEGMIPTFAPVRHEVHRIGLPPGGATFSCESLSTDLTGRVMLAFTSGSTSMWPKGFLVMKAQGAPPQAAQLIEPDPGGFTGNVRQDYCPGGAWIHTGSQQWTGIGLHFPMAPWQLGAYADRVALFCQQKGANLCTGL